MLFYPDQRHMLDLTTIRRERLLPAEALGGVEVAEGVGVNLRDIVARGSVPSRYVMVPAAEFFRLKSPADLEDLLNVQPGSAVEKGAALATHKNRRLLSPVEGVVAYIGEGLIVIQQSPREVVVEAGLEGQVISLIAGRGVVIEAAGALLQGVWGNNRRAVGVLRLEPEDGIETIEGDELNTLYRGAVVVTRRPLRETGLLIMEDQGFVGIIAPSMEADLIEPALNAGGAIMLTEGFGSTRMSATIAAMLTGFVGRQATLDAFLPNRWEARRPEVIINPASRSGGRPPRPNPDLALQIGTQVRLTRAPNAGQVGKVVNLPKTPYLLDNGLRVRCAQVELLTGERVMTPLVNLEVFGR
ncbi:MAG: hypothetical protein DWB42_05785 [Chloroflexi bacterium]|nr:hypothetical protein [Chloroflexota bacterium]MDL1883082.1 hypothetical protein [Anaerolineae bacterium CFX8]